MEACTDADGPSTSGDVLERRRGRRPGGSRAARGPAVDDRGVAGRAPRRGRTRRVVPQRRPRLEHRHRARGRRDPSIEAYTIAFRVAEDQRLEAMPDDARYARRMAKHLGIQLHEIEISPDVVDLLPRMVDILDEPIGDPAAINTLLMCDTARDAGVKVLLSGMGADEMFGGYRKHLACVLSGRYRRVPRTLRDHVVASDRAAPAGDGVRPRDAAVTRWAQRFLTFAELPEEAAFRRSYTMFDRDELRALLDPTSRIDVDGVLEAPRPGVRRQRPGRPRRAGCVWRTRACSWQGST